jgi:uroporphyrinogen-III synthase/uroporphyrinogen III methyltransferase/synthase
VSDLSLRGRVVAVTRLAGAEDALSERLRTLGAEVLEAPAIALAPPPSWAPLDAALAALDRTAWIAFASANAAESTAARAAEVGVAAAALARPRLAAVGAATADRVTRLLRPPDLVPPIATGAALAAALGPLARGERVLVPRADDGRPELVEGLAAAGVDVVAPSVYRTVAAPPDALAPLARALAAGRVDAIAFLSPSAVRSVAAAVAPELLARACLAAIGPTTADALRAVGLAPVAQPARASGAALADAIAERVGPRSG